MKATIGEKSIIENIELFINLDRLSIFLIGASTGSVMVYSKSIALLSLETGSQVINTLAMSTHSKINKTNNNASLTAVIY
jgi:hypothetical protein